MNAESEHSEFLRHNEAMSACTCLWNHTATGPRSIHQADARCPQHGEKRMTTAEVFSDYLGLTPENAPWAYDYVVCPECHGTSYIHNVDESSRCLRCEGRGMATHAYSRALILTATSPLAPNPTPGWLEVLVRREKFRWLDPCGGGNFFGVAQSDLGIMRRACATHPTHAVARALIAADPKLREACEQASDWEEVK